MRFGGQFKHACTMGKVADIAFSARFNLRRKVNLVQIRLFGGVQSKGNVALVDRIKSPAKNSYSSYRVSLFTGKASNSANTLGVLLCCSLRYSFVVFHIRLSPFLNYALHHTQVREVGFLTSSPACNT